MNYGNINSLHPCRRAGKLKLLSLAAAQLGGVDADFKEVVWWLLPFDARAMHGWAPFFFSG
jgi:hypothetical protein